MISPVPPPDADDRGGAGLRLLWFAGIAAASSLLTAALAYALRAMPFVG
jgi:hypothetical protein